MPTLPPVAVDPQRFGQALGNLLDNALTYTEAAAGSRSRPPRSARTASASRWPTPASASRRSTCRTSSRSSSACRARAQGRGTGLGLAIVREIVTAHGGEVACESQPGKGTVFHLTVPVWQAAHAVGRAAAMSNGSPDQSRPPPEHFLSLIREQQRGRLKVYLGFAAGVGKTYEMLQEGHRLKQQGVDVVIGVVETHGRAETAALIDDLEQVPRRRIEYRGVVLEEMDLDALLRRQPTVALVDELAHTNAPGSRNAKRYQDVEELLRAGINVITHAEHPAPRKPVRHGRGLHRRQGQGARAGLRPGRGRPDRQRGRVGRGLAGAAQGRQGLPGRAHRERADQLLHRRAT